jgi:hypothetical protein
MARRKYAKKRRFSKKRRSIRRTGKRLYKAIKRVIKRTSEKKHVFYNVSYRENAGVPSVTNTLDWGGIFSYGFWIGTSGTGLPVYLNLSQGTGKGNRVGNRVQLNSLYINVNFHRSIGP